MRRRAVIAGFLAATLAGCATAKHRRSPEADPAALARRQQYSQQAQAAIDRKDWPAAHAALDRLLEEVPKSAEAHQRLGRVLQAQGRPADAEIAYRRALEIDPDYADALIGLGRVEASTGRLLAALGHLDAAVEVNPHRAEAHLEQARTLESLGRLEDALAAYFRAIKEDENLREAILRVATIQLDRNQPEQALARLSRALELEPDDPEARHQRGRAHLALHHAEAAVEDLRFASQKLTGQANLYYELALALDADNRRADARLAIEQAVKLAPNWAEARALSEKLRR